MLATVASMTSANRLKRCAGEEGIFASVIQTPHSLTKEGCGYSLRFDDRYMNAIKKCAAGLNIKVRAFFYENIIDGEKIYVKA